ncbi:response regulator, partial [Salmonella enterica subsp. enterica serovar Hadar]
IGWTELVWYVRDSEKRIKIGKHNAMEQLTDLRQKIRMIFKNYTIT